VCARDGECLLASQVHIIHVTWTLQGAAASAMTCASSPDLEIDFTDASGEQLGFAPVPCAEGKFTIDKMPTWYTSVSLGLEGTLNYVAFDSMGNAAIDLPY
jgi:hypothetical protein